VGIIIFGITIATLSHNPDGKPRTGKFDFWYQ